MNIKLRCPWCRQLVDVNYKAEMCPHKSGATSINRTTKPWTIVRQQCAFGGVTINEALQGITRWKRDRIKSLVNNRKPRKRTKNG